MREMVSYPIRSALEWPPRWRRYVPVDAIAAPAVVSTEALVDGEWIPVGRIDSRSWKTYGVDGEEVAFGTIERIRTIERPIEIDDLPRIATRRTYIAALAS